MYICCTDMLFTFKKYLQEHFQWWTYFSPMSHFYTPWKRQKSYGFLTFSEVIEMWHWTKMSTTLNSGYTKYLKGFSGAGRNWYIWSKRASCDSCCYQRWSLVIFSMISKNTKDHILMWIWKENICFVNFLERKSFLLALEILKPTGLARKPGNI